MRKRTLSREYALQILYQFEMNEETLQAHFESFWSQHEDATDEVREFAEKIVNGTQENQKKLDEVIKQYAENWELDRMASIDRNILRFATYELLFLKDIPPKVTINEAVNIAKKYSQEDAGKFVNGILDKINHTVNKDGVKTPAQEDSQG